MIEDRGNLLKVRKFWLVFVLGVVLFFSLKIQVFIVKFCIVLCSRNSCVADDTTNKTGPGLIHSHESLDKSTCFSFCAIQMQIRSNFWSNYKIKVTSTGWTSADIKGSNLV